MKRILFTLVIGLFAAQADAVLWELDRPTALGFTTVSNYGGAGDDVGLLDVYDGPGNEVFDGGGITGYSWMSGLVGFVTTTFGDGPDADTTATAEISGGNPGLVQGFAPLYTGITSYFQNDDDDLWSVELWYVSGGTEYSSGFTPLAGFGGSAYLSTGAPVGGLDLSTITDMGIRVQGNLIGPDAFNNPSNADAFHVSVSVEQTCSLEVEMTACVSVPPSGEDDCKGRVISMILEYTGDGCDASSHSQKSDKVGCSGDPDGTEPVTILVTNKKGDRQWGAAVDLYIGGTVEVDAANAAKDKLDADTLVTIFDESSGNELQEVKFHTSCSQPLSVSDQFGGVKVISMTTTEGGTVTSSPDGSCITELPGSGGAFDVKYTYTVTNTGATLVTDVTVVDDVFGTVPGSPIASISAGETVVLTAVASLSEATTNTVIVEADEACSAEATAEITKAPPEPEECTTKVQAMLLKYIGPTVPGPVTVTIKADKFKDDLVSYTFGGDLVPETILSLVAENDWTIDATEHTTTDKRGNVKQCVELGAKTEISINGVKEVIHTSCSAPFVSGQPAPLDNPKGDPSPNWFVVDFWQK